MMDCGCFDDFLKHNVMTAAVTTELQVICMAPVNNLGTTHPTKRV